MKDDNTPAPGTPAYDAMMVAKYRDQNRRETPLTDDGLSSDSFEHKALPGVGTVSIRRDSTLGPSNAPERFTAAQADPAQLADIRREIAFLRDQLAESVGATRTTQLKRLELLENVVMPTASAMQQRAARWRQENVPSTLETLTAEKERVDAIRARAEAIADEREAQAQATKIAASRRAIR